MVNAELLPVLRPNYGLVYNQGNLSIPKRGLKDGMNFRIQNGVLNNLNLGWSKFANSGTSWILNGPCALIADFTPRNGTRKQVFGSYTDLYSYNATLDQLTFLTPQYDTGTVTVVGTAVTGAGTAWNVAANAGIGDYIHFGAVDFAVPHGIWYPISAIPGAGSITLPALATNLFTQTEDFSNADWTKTRATIVANSSVDPNRTSLADTLKEDATASSTHETSRTTAATVNTNPYTLSVYVKEGSRAAVELVLASSPALTRSVSCIYDVTTANVPSVGTVTTAGGATGSATITIIGDGWRRLTLTATLGGAEVAIKTSIRLVSGGTSTYSGNNASGLDIWGAQLETGSSATYYIPRVATSGTLAYGAGSAYTIRNIFGGSRTNPWQWDIFTQDGTSNDDLMFFTNGIDWVNTWDGGDATTISQSAMGFTCDTLRSFKNMMCYFNIVAAGDHLPTDMINSDVGFPLNAGSTGTGLSEQFRVHDGNDEILCARKTADMLVVYSKRHCIPVQFVGDPLVFTFRDAVSDIGPLGPNAVADYGDYHEFLGLDVGYRFDGVSIDEINPHVMREIVRQTDVTRQSTTFAHFVEEFGEVLWSVPNTSDDGAGTVTSPSATAWVEHYLEDVPQGVGTPFSRRALPFLCAGYYARTEAALTWDTATGMWSSYNYAWNDQFFSIGFPQTLVGDENGIIYVLNETQNGDGDLLASYVRTGRYPTLDGRAAGLLARIYPFTYQFAGGELDVTAFMYDHADGAVKSTTTVAFDLDLNEGEHFVSIFRTGRFYECKFATDGEPWKLEGYDKDIRSGGFR